MPSTGRPTPGEPAGILQPPARSDSDTNVTFVTSAEPWARWQPSRRHVSAEPSVASGDTPLLLWPVINLRHTLHRDEMSSLAEPRESAIGADPGNPKGLTWTPLLG